MKKFLFILIGFLTAVQSPCVTAQELPSSIVTAQVVNDQGDPVEYATVQMRDHKDSTRFFGTITDENGKFELTVPPWRLQPSNHLPRISGVQPRSDGQCKDRSRKTGDVHLDC